MTLERLYMKEVFIKYFIARVSDTFQLSSSSDSLALVLRTLRHRLDDGARRKLGRNFKESPTVANRFASVKQQGRCLQVGWMNNNLARIHYVVDDVD